MAFVYILYSETKNVFYIRSCLNLQERLIQHNTHFIDHAFTKRASDREFFWSIEVEGQDLARKIEANSKKTRTRG